MTTRRAAVVALATLVATVALVGCGGSAGPRATRLIVAGQAEVSHPGQDRHEVTGTRSLQVGDRVRVRRGTAVVRLSGDRQVELRLGSELDLVATPANGGVRPDVVAGDALVSSAQPLTVTVNGTEASVQGTARVSRGLALLVATYEGAADVSSAGKTISVGALRQVALPAAGLFPVRTSPLEYSPADSWDQRFLSDAMELGDQLVARSRGFSAQLGPTEGRTVNFFRDLLPRLAAEPAFDASLLGAPRPAGETLVGAAIALAGTHGTFAERWAAVFRFHDEGAPWGLVARDQGVNRAPLLGAIDSAISKGPTLFADAPPSRGTSFLSPPATRPPATAPTTVATPPTTSRPPARPATPPTTTSASAPPAATGPVNTGSPVIDNTVKSLVDTLTGLLKGLGGP